MPFNKSLIAAQIAECLGGVLALWRLFRLHETWTPFSIGPGFGAHGFETKHRYIALFCIENKRIVLIFESTTIPLPLSPSYNDLRKKYNSVRLERFGCLYFSSVDSNRRRISNGPIGTRGSFDGSLNRTRNPKYRSVKTRSETRTRHEIFGRARARGTT